VRRFFRFWDWDVAIMWTEVENKFSISKKIWKKCSSILLEIILINQLIRMLIVMRWDTRYEIRVIRMEIPNTDRIDGHYFGDKHLITLFQLPKFICARSLSVCHDKSVIIDDLPITQSDSLLFDKRIISPELYRPLFAWYLLIMNWETLLQIDCRGKQV